MLELQDLTLNINYVVYNFLIAAVGSTVVTILSFWIAKRKNIKALYLFGLHFLFLTLSCTFEAIAELLLFIPLRHFSIFSNVLMVFTFLLFFNYIRKESFISWDLSIWAALAAIIVFLEMDPNNHYIRYGIITTLARASIINTWMEIAVIYYLILILYWMILTIVKSPKNLKKASILLISSIPISIAVIYVSDEFFHLHQLASWVIVVFNSITLMVLIYRPQLLFVLPFKAYRLTVIHANTGISLFQYEWSGEEIDEDLLSGLITAIRSMGEEILKRGGIRQIDWDLGLLFFSKGKFTLTTLLSSKASKSLRANLSAFADAFETKFKLELESGYTDVSKFEPAKDLIEDYFANIPIYKN